MSAERGDAGGAGDALARAVVGLDIKRAVEVDGVLLARELRPSCIPSSSGSRMTTAHCDGRLERRSSSPRMTLVGAT
jgi:hypothetical protein